MAKIDRLKKQKKLLDIRGAELFCRGLCFIEEIEEKDHHNRKARLTAERAKATIIRNNIFNLKTFK